MAHDRMTMQADREIQIDMDGVVAVLFSAAALEAFINELSDLAKSQADANPEFVASFASLTSTAEESRGSTRLKYAIAGHAFTGRAYDRSAEPFQSLDLILSVRDQIVHLKAELLEFDGDRRPVASSHDGILKKLRSKGILAKFNEEDFMGSSPTWISLLSTRAAARWACNVAADVVSAVLDSIPPSRFRDDAEFFYRSNFKLVGADK